MAENCISVVSVCLLESWSEVIATSLLHGLESAIKTGVQMAKAASDAEVVFPNSTPEPPV